MAVKEVHGPGPRGARGPRPKVENPGKLLKRIMDEVFRNYLPHCILVLVCIVVSALANVQASLFLQTLMDDYIVPMTRQQNPSFAPLAGALVREVRPTALICVDSLCSSEPQRLGRTLQFSDTGLCPAQPGSSKHREKNTCGCRSGKPTDQQIILPRQSRIQEKDIITGNQKPRYCSCRHSNKIIRRVRTPFCLIQLEFSPHVNHDKSKTNKHQPFTYRCQRSIRTS